LLLLKIFRPGLITSCSMIIRGMSPMALTESF